MDAVNIAGLLSRVAFRYVDEISLQDAIELVFQKHGIPSVREFSLSPRDRIDFFCEGVGVEVKIASSLMVVQRQLWRYAADPRIKSLVLVTTRSSHRALPDELQGKPLVVAHLLASIF